MNTSSSSEINIIDIGHMIEGYSIIGGFSTTAGLKKNINEDRIGILKGDRFFRGCLCDGHWGDGAAESVLSQILSTSFSFPRSREEAVSKLEEIEESIFHSFGIPELNGINDTTPETAFVAFEVSGSTIKIFSYGDCRLFLLGKISGFHLPTIPSWIGSFSHLGLRGRVPVSNGVFFSEIEIKDSDIILFFSDGIDECIYEKTTLTFPEICNIVKSNDTHRASIETLISRVYQYGAEDNASIGVFHIINEY